MSHSTNGKYQVTGLTANNATAEFRMVIDQAASPTGQSGQAIEQTFSISKSVKDPRHKAKSYN